ncbi:response regulator [Alsobacter sp. SYSU BS001988]
MVASRSILLVEDDPHLRYAFEKFLGSKGYNVTATGSSFEAIELLDGPLPFDVLVTDVVLGKDSPHGVSLALMARARRTGLPVLFITAFEEFIEFAQAHGPVMLKPVEGRDLAQMIGRELDGVASR